MAETWHVYQFRSETGELLYVGYTRWLERRLLQHKHSKSWWQEVADTKAEEFVTEDDARQREKDLWAREHPKYNKKNPFRTAEDDRLTRRRAEAKYNLSSKGHARHQRWGARTRRAAPSPGQARLW